MLGEAEIAQAMTQSDLVHFGYTFNKPGAIVMLGGAALLVAAAVGIWVGVGLSHFAVYLCAALLVLMSIGVVAYVYKWHRYTETHSMSMSATHIYVGTSQSAWRISWDILDPSEMGFDRISTSRFSSALKMRLGGQDIELFLYNPLAHLSDLQSFILEMLSQVAPQAALDADSSEEE
jgi:hypothetical protein